VTVESRVPRMSLIGRDRNHQKRNQKLITRTKVQMKQVMKFGLSILVQGWLNWRGKNSRRKQAEWLGNRLCTIPTEKTT